MLSMVLHDLLEVFSVILNGTPWSWQGITYSQSCTRQSTSLHGVYSDCRIKCTHDRAWLSIFVNPVVLSPFVI